MRWDSNFDSSCRTPLTIEIIWAKLADFGSFARVSHDSGAASGAAKLEIC
jgi:hypothetical protein